MHQLRRGDLRASNNRRALFHERLPRAKTRLARSPLLERLVVFVESGERTLTVLQRKRRDDELRKALDRCPSAVATVELEDPIRVLAINRLIVVVHDGVRYVEAVVAAQLQADTHVEVLKI
jgi:hypothetical protein